MKSKTLRSLAAKVNLFKDSRGEPIPSRKEPALRLVTAGGTPTDTSSVAIYDSYPECYKGFIAPLKRQHPKWKRLDGSITKKGNPTPVTWFRHAGKIWEINADTRFEVLSIINDGWMKWGESVLIEKPTATRKSLKPRPELGSLQYCYIYLSSKKSAE